MPDAQWLRTNEAKQAIRRAAVGSGLQLLNAIGGLDDDAVAEFVTRFGPMRQAAIVSTAQLVDAYVDAFLRAHGDQLTGARINTTRLLDEVRLGTTVEEELERPFVEARTTIAKGGSFDEAMTAAAARARGLIGTDVQQAYRLGMAERLTAEPRIPGYRRLLVGAVNCTLCITASTVRYRTDKLMPIHPGCDCSVEPLAPGTAVNRAGTLTSEVPRLDQVKDIIDREGISYVDRSGLADLKVELDGLDEVTEVPHGELGPILSLARHNPTTLPWTRQSRREFDQTGRLVRS